MFREGNAVLSYTYKWKKLIHTPEYPSISNKDMHLFVLA